MSAASASSENRRVRLLVRTLVWLLVGVLAFVLVAAWALLFRAERPVEAGRPARIVVAPGDSTASIARQLAEAGVVRSQYMFRLRTRLADADGRLAPGEYELKTGMAYEFVIRELRRGPLAPEVTVTIPEGFVVEQIAERLEQVAGIPAADTRALARGGASKFAGDHPYLKGAYGGSLEGYLFPKTYSVRKGAPARDALEMMLDQFDAELRRIDLKPARERGLDAEQVVIIASIIEREARVDAERELVSSVIHNRLNRGMLLEIDATVEYVLPGNRFRLRYSDLRIDSPYNTYRFRGLPPGPISNPGLASLEAAAHPADTSYLYYVLTGRDGSHTFARNKKDFLKAKAKSKEVFGR